MNEANGNISLLHSLRLSSFDQSWHDDDVVL